MNRHRVYGPRSTQSRRGVHREWIQRKPFPFRILPWSSPSSAPEHSDYEPESDDDIVPVQVVQAVSRLVRQSFRGSGTRRVIR